MALASLHDFAEDSQLRREAAMQLDALFLDIALHSHRGVCNEDGTRLTVRHGQERLEFDFEARRRVGARERHS